MNLATFDFEQVCPTLTKEERGAVERYLNEECFAGGVAFRNYIFRLIWLVAATGTKRVVELGCIPGGSSLAFLCALRGTGGQLVSADIGPPWADCCTRWGLPESYRERWRKVPNVPAAAYGRDWKEGPVDLVYLDTSHRREATLEEIRAWLPHVREGGLFVFHDVESCRPEVFAAVAQAVCDTPSKSYEYVHFADCYGHGVLQPLDGWRFDVGQPRGSGDDGMKTISRHLAEAGLELSRRIEATVKGASR